MSTSNESLSSPRRYRRSDQLCCILDNCLRTVAGNPAMVTEKDPSTHLPEAVLSRKEQHLSARLMRVNYCGEVCAQALYQGQIIMANNASIKAQLSQAALEENNHLQWCDHRLQALYSHRSYLNLLFYIASFSMGVVTGYLGDRISLGFVEETERQVANHLDFHLSRLPKADRKSQCVLIKMREDEKRHGKMANASGAAPLPLPIKKLMRLLAIVMTHTTYWI